MSDAPSPYTPPPQTPYSYQPGSAGAPVYAQSSIAGPLKVIAVIHFVLGGLALIGALFMLASGFVLKPQIAASDPAHAAVGSAFIFLLAALVLLFALLHLVVGYGLLQFKPWGRILAIVFSCFNLFSFPFGTALGGFTLYFLLKSGAAQEYQQLSTRTVGY